MANQRKKRRVLRRIARERVFELLKNCERYPDFSSEYVERIKELKKHYKLSFDWNIKKMFCKHCDTYLGRYPKTRISKNRISIICHNCGRKREYIIKEKRIKKQ